MSFSKSNIFWGLLMAWLIGVAIGSWLGLGWLGTYPYLGFIPGLLLIGIGWRRHWGLVLIGLGLLLLVGGWIRVSQLRFEQTILTQATDTNFSPLLRGYVSDSPVLSGANQRIVFTVEFLRLGNWVAPYRLHEKILVTTDAYPRYHYGDKLQLTGKLTLPTNTTDFDYISYLARDQIFTLMYQPKIESANFALEKITRAKIWFYGGLFKARDYFSDQVAEAVKEPAAAYINGILLGTRANIPADIKADFATTGLSHILAISGYNISIIALVIAWSLSWLMPRSKAFWLAVVIIILFTLLTGASASVVRAAVMGTLVLIGELIGRLYNPRNALTLAAALMVAFNPLILRYDVGFQLSFLATAGLLYLSPLWRQAKWLHWLPNWFNLRDTLATTLSAQMMVLPLAFYYFHTFSLIALPANLIILPLVPALMALGFATGVAGSIWSVLGKIVGVATWLLATIQLYLVSWLAKLPGAALPVKLDWLGLLLAYILLICGLYFYYKKKTKLEPWKNAPN